MTNWNYRVVKDEQNNFSIREVYYTDGKVDGHTANPRVLIAESEEDLKQDIEYILKAFDKPILIEKDDQLYEETT